MELFSQTSRWSTWRPASEVFLLPRVLRFLGLIWSARRMARDVRLVADAMEYLNHFTERELRAGKQTVYWLKRLLIGWFYWHYPCDVAKHEQKLKCHRCGGRGVFDVYRADWVWARRDTCWECGGTGVFKTNELIGFTFHIEGNTYSWHQPADLVDERVYRPTLFSEPYVGVKRERFTFDFGTDKTQISFLVVHQYLVQQGFPIYQIGLRSAIAHDLRAFAPYVKDHWRVWYNRFMRWLGNNYYEVEWDDIPF